MQDVKKFCHLGLAVIETEAKAVSDLSSRIDEHFAKACQHLLDCEGRIIVTGMGKSGHIGNKIAATFASTGSPAFYVHPGEASHGDLGMITKKDVVLAISNSGETAEILTILPLIKRLGVPLISMTGEPHSTIALASTVNIDVSVHSEACPLGLAPTASTTATLAMGDALAIALLETRGFTKDDFAFVHPGGMLGRRLLLRIDNVMRTHDDIPRVLETTLLQDALTEMSKKGLGMTAVVDQEGLLKGIFTDGDLRRTLDRGDDIRTTLVSQVMTTRCKTITTGLLAAEAMRLMQTFEITALLVTEESNKLKGIVHIHDLLRAGVA